MLAAALCTGVTPAVADGPPTANVSCSLTDTGVRYGVSMVFSGSGVSFNSLRYEWEYLVADAGKNPTLVSSYGPRTSQSITAGNGLELTYEALLALSKNDENASVLMYVSSIFSDGLSTITNKTGSGCYVELPVVLNNKNDQAAIVQKAATDKAAAELQAKQAAEIKLAAELQAKREAADAKAAAEKAAAASLAKQKDAVAKALANKKTTITCIKGKTLKKVTAVKPVCPKGYKKK